MNEDVETPDRAIYIRANAQPPRDSVDPVSGVLAGITTRESKTNAATAAQLDRAEASTLKHRRRRKPHSATYHRVTVPAVVITLETPDRPDMQGMALVIVEHNGGRNVYAGPHAQGFPIWRRPLADPSFSDAEIVRGLVTEYLAAHPAAKLPPQDPSDALIVGVDIPAPMEPHR